MYVESLQASCFFFFVCLLPWSYTGFNIPVCTSLFEEFAFHITTSMTFKLLHLVDTFKQVDMES